MCGQEEYGKSKCTSDTIFMNEEISHYVDLEIEWVKISSCISVLSALHLIPVYNFFITGNNATDAHNCLNSWKPKYEVKIEGSN